MSAEKTFDEIAIGDVVGPQEYLVDEKAIKDFVEYGLWDSKKFPMKGPYAPPGFSVTSHARLSAEALGGPGVRVWAKSEHEYFQPVRLGGKIIKRGKIVDKYTKRGRDYFVTEIETFDEKGTLLFRSLETIMMSMRREEKP